MKEKTEVKSPTGRGRKAAPIAEDIRAGILDGSCLGLPLYMVIKELNKDRLDNKAVITDSREYTYRQMFRMWEKYAEVFSALDITGKNKSRAAIFYPRDMETISAYFALNMTGTTVSLIESLKILDFDSVIETLKKEKVTDIIACDYALTPATADMLLNAKEEIGIKNIVIIKNTAYRKLLTPFENVLYDMNYMSLRAMPGLSFMEDLVKEYEAFPITYADERKDFTAAIFHTSGTTKGIKKPIPFTNRQLNSAASFVFKTDAFKKFEGNARMILEHEISHAYFNVDQMMTIFFLGCTLVLPYLGIYGKDHGKIIKKYNINVWITVPVFFDMLMDAPVRPDLSNIELVVMGGIIVSADKKKKINEGLRKCGSNAKVLIGYGLTEAGGACILTREDMEEDDSVGYPLPGVNIKIQDEETKKFYDITDGERIGGLYINSDSLSSGMLDGETFFKLTRIDGKPYICTNDLFEVNKNGSLTCRGRMNSYFVNNEGVRFDAGLIETAIVKEKGIKNCVIVPGFHKDITDTVPLLVVTIEDNEESEEQTIKTALYNVFINNDAIKKTNLPVQAIILNTMPLNSMGKVDRYSIDFNKMDNKRLNVYPINDDDGTLRDVVLVPSPINDVFGVSVPEEIRNKEKKTLNERLNDPECIKKFAPALLSLAMTEFYQMVFFTDFKDKGANNMDSSKENTNFPPFPFPPFGFKAENKSEENKGQWQPPFPFPPFPKAEQSDDKKENGGNPPFPPFGFQPNWQKCENKGQWQPPFPFPPFDFQQPDNKETKEENTGKKEEVPPMFEFMKGLEKQELSHEEVEKILDGVQDLIGYFFKADKIGYTYEED